MKKVLTIDGGGIKGLIPAIVCHEIERRSGRPMADSFQLVAGTSTGAIIAAALGVGMRAGRIVDLYQTQGPRIFRNPRWFLTRLVRAKYAGSQLHDVLSDYFGDAELGDVQTHVMTTAYDITGRWAIAGNPGPVFFKSWRDALQTVSLVDAVQASSAAPSYFPPHRVNVPWAPEETACMYDGGLYAGDPALCAYAEARVLWPEEPILVVSLGTGRREVPTSCSEADGLLQLAQRLHGWMLDGSTDSVPYVADRILPRYIRLDAHLPHHVAMDDTSPEAIETLRQTARDLIEMHDDALDTVSK